MKHKIGNEIDNLGTGMMEADYRRDSWFRSWVRTFFEALLVCLAFATIFTLMVFIHWAQQG